jgi:DNA-binding LytR/AlgR family response regulator
MKPFSCILVDDEDLALDLLTHFLKDEETISIKGAFSDSKKALEVINDIQVPLLILDINMPGLNGLELITKLQYDPIIIFTTAHANHAIEAFNLNVLDYVLKPISKERFLVAIQKAKQQYAYRVQDTKGLQTLTLKRNKYEYEVALSDIFFIEGMKQYAVYHTAQGKFYHIETLKSVEEKLLPLDFIRIHKSYIVNIVHIQKKSVSKMIVNGVEIAIGRSYSSK